MGIIFFVVAFKEGEKTGRPDEKNPWRKEENQQQTQPTYVAEFGNRTRATLVGGERSRHCAITSPTNTRSVEGVAAGIWAQFSLDRSHDRLETLSPRYVMVTFLTHGKAFKGGKGRKFDVWGGWVGGSAAELVGEGRV